MTWVGIDRVCVFETTMLQGDNQMGAAAPGQNLQHPLIGCGVCVSRELTSEPDTGQAHFHQSFECSRDTGSPVREERLSFKKEKENKYQQMGAGPSCRRGVICGPWMGSLPRR